MSLKWGLSNQQREFRSQFKWFFFINCLLLMKWTCELHFGMFLGVILVHLTFGQSHWWDLMGVASDSRRHKLRAKSLMFWLLESFCHLFHNVPWAIGIGVLCICMLWYWALQLCILVGFSVMVSISCKEKSPWWGVKITLICGYKNKYLECS